MQTSFSYLAFEAPILITFIAGAWLCLRSASPKSAVRRFGWGLLLMAAGRAFTVAAAPLVNLGGSAQIGVAQFVSWLAWASVVAAGCAMLVGAAASATPPEPIRTYTS
jgi:hypothetical protein